MTASLINPYLDRQSSDSQTEQTVGPGSFRSSPWRGPEEEAGGGAHPLQVE